MAIDYLVLYSADCKVCGHLDEAEAKKFVKCHFSKGNKACPASEVRLVVAGKATRMASSVLEARRAKKPEAEAKILSLLSKESPAVRTRFYSELESLCQNQLVKK